MKRKQNVDFNCDKRYAPLAQQVQSTRLLIEESWVRVPYGAP